MSYKEKQRDYSYTFGDMNEIVRCLVGMVDSMISDRMSHFQYSTSEDEEFLLKAIEHYVTGGESTTSTTGTIRPKFLNWCQHRQRIIESPNKVYGTKYCFEEK